MKYEIRQPARSGDIVPLVAVADAKARFQATAGGTDFHRPAYDGTFNPFADDLLREAKAGKLKVCNCLGIPGEAEALVAEAERTGDLPVFYRYLIEPDWERLRREVEPVAPGVRNLSHLDLGPSEVDWTRTHLGALFTTLKWLNEWGSDRGDQFTVTHEGVEWFDERGIQRPRGTGAASEPAPTDEAPEARDDRRYRELKGAGGDYVEEDGNWHATGPRGLLAKLCKREKAAGRPMSNEKDVRESLKKAAKRAHNARTKGSSIFNQ